MDYKLIGLKIGLEIHQQLNTGKLFCNCSSEIDETGKTDFVIERRLRAAMGETGEIDIAALMEQKKELYFKYNGYNKSSCLVEMDEEPPYHVNSKAFECALQTSLMLKCGVIDEVQVMRKTVADGSNTSAFQRTALVAMNGKICTSIGDVGIQTVCLEEDSCKDIAKEEDYRILGLDRLGIPLVEIATDASIQNPEQAREVSAYLGMVLRSTGKAKRGIGTIRQDVNVSIKNGQRVEIKGTQELKMIPRWIEEEIVRQENLIHIKNEILKRTNIQGLEKDLKIADATHLLEKSESKVIKNALSKKGVIKGIKLKGFKGLVGYDIQIGRRLGTEFSDYAKIYAGVGGLFHSDELPNYGITEREVDLLRKKFSCGEDDAFLIIADSEEKVDRALNAIMKRVVDVFKGVLPEVRRPNADGSTSFMRPIPGSARMYPETDVAPIKTDLKNIKIPELIVEKSEKIMELGLAKDLADLISREGLSETLVEFAEKYPNVKPAFIAETMLPTLKEIQRKHKINTDKIHKTDFDKIFAALDAGMIPKESVIEIIAEVCKGKNIDIMIQKFELLTDIQLEKELQKIIKESGEIQFNALIGRAMGSLRGKAEGKKIVDMLKKLKK